MRRCAMASLLARPGRVHTVSSTVGGGVMGPNGMPDLQNLLFVVVSRPFGGLIIS
jgi:hypothetical protein